VQARKKMEEMAEAMKNPVVQQQMAEAQAAMQNTELQERLKSLQGDPEFKGMFEDIQENGIGALMKYMNDPDALRKLGSRMGDISSVAPAAAAAAAGQAAPTAEPQVNDLLDAARCARAMHAAEVSGACCGLAADVLLHLTWTRTATMPQLALQWVRSASMRPRFPNTTSNTCSSIASTAAVRCSHSVCQMQLAQTPNPHACRFGDVEATEDFIAVGKDVNMQDAEGRTPLHYAAAHDQAKIIRLLAEAGADLEKTDRKQNTCLHYAAGYGRVDIVDILLERGADLQAQNENGKTPFAVAGLNPKNPLFDEENSDMLQALQGPVTA
jgi:Ankyrin repeats (3 copies)